MQKQYAVKCFEIYCVTFFKWKERTSYSYRRLNVDAAIPAVANAVDKFEHWSRQSNLISVFWGEG